MMRSLYSGVSGLRNHQTRMDVIGNNIANVNTTGYKASRAVFSDIYSQTLRTASMGDGEQGGRNPAQIGLGVMLSAIDILFNAAATQRTDNATDLAIEGDGFFIIQPPMGVPEDMYAGETVDGEDGPIGIRVNGFNYTRAGNFYVDAAGYLVNSNGYYVMGFAVDYTAGDGDTPGEMSVRLEEGLQRIDLYGTTGLMFDDTGTVWAMREGVREPLYKVAIATFTNNGGLEKIGESLYMETGNSGAAIATTAHMNGAGKINPGGLEMSSTDLASEFTDMIVTQRGFQANSRIITTSDTLLEELVNLKR